MFASRFDPPLNLEFMIAVIAAIGGLTGAELTRSTEDVLAGMPGVLCHWRALAAVVAGMPTLAYYILRLVG
jgi:hypothetical protein